MNFRPTALLLALVLLAPAARAADARLEAQLTSLDYTYKVDEDGDYRLVFETGDDGSRSQLVYVRSPVETLGEHRVREIWAPGYHSPGDSFPANVANRLLEASHDVKLGGWTKQGRYAVFVVKVSADATAAQLRDAIEAAAESADEIEAELTPGKDEL
ncbi:MAG: hypothetical protein ACOY37_10670 [Pseudomonadota bacterium]